MSIIRGPKPENNWYMLDKNISQDRRLSWQARGLLIYLLGKPDHWQVSVEALKKETAESVKPTSRDGIYSILKELESAGYVARKPGRDDSGRMTGFEYVVSEKPLPPNPLTAEPLTAERAQASNESKQVLNPSKSSVEQAQPVPLEKILRLYNEICGDVFKKASLMNNAREKNIRKCWAYKVNGKLIFQSAQFWTLFFNRCLLNEHWRGNNDRGWRASLEFLTRMDVMERVVDEILVEMEAAA